MKKLKLGDMLSDKETVLHFTQYPEGEAPAGYALTVHGADYYVCLVSYNFTDQRWQVDKSYCYNIQYRLAIRAYNKWRKSVGLYESSG